MLQHNDHYVPNMRTLKKGLTLCMARFHQTAHTLHYTAL